MMMRKCISDVGVLTVDAETEDIVASTSIFPLESLDYICSSIQDQLTLHQKTPQTHPFPSLYKRLTYERRRLRAVMRYFTSGQSYVSDLSSYIGSTLYTQHPISCLKAHIQHFHLRPLSHLPVSLSHSHNSKIST